ncbi:hypothetical protein LTR97_003047 [Elasticomyces elasticus]|uniref:Uncharacterized protein n=1 Tax=Elasticomyces elasticus TaxID=574655 RepID=A0AAN7WG03_9PEZI|nr:hypothetical protein LTR97_003047 [Elasticomyces elasticus]KAK5725758.1 hypothetical protein LTR15_003948 [Elasticomyces elasticus]
MPSRYSGSDSPLQEYDAREYQPNSSFPGRHYADYDRPATRTNSHRSYSPHDTSRSRDENRYSSASSSRYDLSASRSGGASYDRLAEAAAALRGGGRENEYSSSTSTSRYGSRNDSSTYDYTPPSPSRDRYSSSTRDRESSSSSYTRRGSDLRYPFSSTGSSRESDNYAFSPDDIGHSSGRDSSSSYGEKSPYTTREYAPSSSSRAGSSSRYAFSPDNIGRSSTSSSRRYGSSSGSRSGWRSGY